MRCGCAPRHETPDTKHRYTGEITGQRLTPDREKPQTETQTSNFCSCFQRWNAERKYVGLDAPHTLDQNFHVENMNKSLMYVCVSSCVFVWCVSDWCRWSGVLDCVSLCLLGVVVGGLGCNGRRAGSSLTALPPAGATDAARAGWQSVLAAR